MDTNEIMMRLEALELAVEEVAATLTESTREEAVARLRRLAMSGEKGDERAVVIRAAELLMAATRRGAEVTRVATIRKAEIGRVRKASSDKRPDRGAD
jgi:hypothetical protein